MPSTFVHLFAALPLSQNEELYRGAVGTALRIFFSRRSISRTSRAREPKEEEEEEEEVEPKTEEGI